MEKAKSKEELKSIYRKAVKQFHPDYGGQNSDMAKINAKNDEFGKKF